MFGLIDLLIIFIPKKGTQSKKTVLPFIEEDNTGGFYTHFFSAFHNKNKQNCLLPLSYIVFKW